MRTLALDPLSEELEALAGTLLSVSHAGMDIADLTRATSNSLWSLLSDESGETDAACWGPRLDVLRACSHVWERGQVIASGRSVAVDLSPGMLWHSYLPLALWIAGRQSADRRQVVGLAGPPGCGKSVFCEILAQVLAEVGSPRGSLRGPGSVAVVGMDGFHFPNAFLDAHSAAGSAGAQTSLRQLKGRPETFDRHTFLSALAAIRNDEVVSLPVYDRRLHDVAPDRIHISSACRMILVEGNFLLHDQAGWERVRPLLDTTIFLNVEPDTCRKRLLGRHVAGGRNKDEAEQHFHRVDAVNIELVANSQSYADLILDMRDDFVPRAARISP